MLILCVTEETHREQHRPKTRLRVDSRILIDDDAHHEEGAGLLQGLEMPAKTKILNGWFCCVLNVVAKTMLMVVIAGKLGTFRSGKAWVWYAPTLPGLPGREESWMFERFQAAGISIAGIDAGESFGSPNGNLLFTAFHTEMVRRGYSDRPIMLGRSRGGLMTMSWAASNPSKVSGFAGIYPVLDLASYPGIAGAAAAFQLSPEELRSRLLEFNPVDRLEGLAKAGVPMFAIHGDIDTVVPLEANSGRARQRYVALGGTFDLIVPPGQGHNMWSGFFECQQLVDFVLQHAVPEPPLIGFTQLQTNLPGGRHNNVRTSRAMLVRADGIRQAGLAESLLTRRFNVPVSGSKQSQVPVDLDTADPDSWTQFAGWSPDGTQAIIARGWQDPENAMWEEQNRTFRMQPGKWSLDCCLVNPGSQEVVNLTAIERVSHYNGGLFYLPEGKGFGFTALINEVSKPFMMNMAGREKRDVSGNGSGFSYGYSASPDGTLISYHENYQVYIAKSDGTEKRHIVTGNTFNFAPQWSPDGQWLLFISGQHGNANPNVVRRDGTELRMVTDLNDYRGWIPFLDVDDFHQGSSDLPVWSADGQSLFCSVKTADRVELFQVTLQGESRQLTHSEPETLHYHPTPSPDGQWLLYGSLRNGARQLFIRNIAADTELPLTQFPAGVAGMWPHWQPAQDSR
jgi:Tol biopolymer transport system component